MECPRCKKKFSNEYFKKHIKNLECCKKAEYKCLKCNKIFKDKTKYNVHINSLKCKRQETNDIETQVNFYDIKFIKNLEKKIEKQEDIINIFVPTYLQNFMYFIYSNIEIENMNDCLYEPNKENNKNIIIKNIIIFLNGMSESILHDFFSLLIKKTSKLNSKKIYIFYLIIKKNINFLKNQEQVKLWNLRVYKELNKSKSNNEKNEIQFE